MKKKIFIIALIVLIIDQLSKFLIIGNFSINKIIDVIPDFFYITKIYNTGGAWSIFSNNTSLLVIIGIMVIYFIVKYISNEVNLNKFSVLYYGLLLGGILGNLLDRIINKYVIDFIGFNIFGYSFPIFNIADVCITLSVLLILLDIIKGEKKDEYNSKK